ncbi:hypothetical protein CALVIDRAFT_370074 [Calocera viscosa TUFC12733]|uniref:Uncharacterized protein n=1 Tax=Calocera viscosa (strain TUFC12733) TaxID=1330018 RepID=A0A167GXI6_CALVF|nr:hypothetical protein CALVIDRAFT_370074 [Calocera viscosa TUFC12733]
MLASVLRCFNVPFPCFNVPFPVAWWAWLPVAGGSVAITASVLAAASLSLPNLGDGVPCPAMWVARRAQMKHRGGGASAPVVHIASRHYNATLSAHDTYITLHYAPGSSARPHQSLMSYRRQRGEVLGAERGCLSEAGGDHGPARGCRVRPVHTP